MAEEAGTQWGRVATYQLGVDSGLVRKWVRQGFLIPRLPRVYALVGASQSVLTDLTEALLYAGPDAMLDGLTAGWWVGALRDKPRRITVSTSHRRRSIDASDLFAFDGIDVHAERALELIWLPRDGRVWGGEQKTAPQMPVTPMTQLALDLASQLELNPLRKALANLEYRRLIDLKTLAKDACGRGRRGTRQLREAIARHEPKLARTKSPSEDDLLFILEASDVPLPDETNTYVDGEEVDAVWHKPKVVVEIDGEGNHGTPHQRERDRRKDMKLRKLGYLVVRFTAEQLRDDPAAVAAEIRTALLSRTALLNPTALVSLTALSA